MFGKTEKDQWSRSLESKMPPKGINRGVEEAYKGLGAEAAESVTKNLTVIFKIGRVQGKSAAPGETREKKGV